MCAVHAVNSSNILSPAGKSGNTTSPKSLNLNPNPNQNQGHSGKSPGEPQETCGVVALGEKLWGNGITGLMNNFYSGGSGCGAGGCGGSGSGGNTIAVA